MGWFEGFPVASLLASVDVEQHHNPHLPDEPNQKREIR
jgi:hypothetical protein